MIEIVLASVAWTAKNNRLSSIPQAVLLSPIHYYYFFCGILKSSLKFGVGYCATKQQNLYAHRCKYYI